MFHVLWDPGPTLMCVTLVLSMRSNVGHAAQSEVGTMLAQVCTCDAATERQGKERELGDVAGGWRASAASATQ